MAVLVAALWCKATGCRAEENSTTYMVWTSLGECCICVLHGDLPLRPAVSRTLLQHSCHDNRKVPNCHPDPLMLRRQPCAVSGGNQACLSLSERSLSVLPKPFGSLPKPFGSLPELTPLAVLAGRFPV